MMTVEEYFSFLQRAQTKSLSVQQLKHQEIYEICLTLPLQELEKIRNKISTLSRFANNNIINIV